MTPTNHCPLSTRLVHVPFFLISASSEKLTRRRIAISLRRVYEQAHIHKQKGELGTDIKLWLLIVTATEMV